MGRSILLWLLGVPIPIIILLALVLALRRFSPSRVAVDRRHRRTKLRLTQGERRCGVAFLSSPARL